MEDLKEYFKNLSTSRMLIIVGLGVVLLSLSQYLELGPLRYTSDSSTVARAILLSLGLVILVTGVVLEIISQRRQSREDHREDPQADISETDISETDISETDISETDVSVDEVFKMVDELTNLKARFQGAYRISILARTAFNILNGHRRLLQDVGEAGCDIRLVIVDPTSEASNYLYGSQSETYEANLRNAVRSISQLKESLGHKFSFRVTSAVPPFSLLQVERNDQERDLIVQLNFMYSRISADRLVFHVSAKDEWYKAFVEEFDTFWGEATEVVDLVDFAESVARNRGWLS